MTKTTRKVKIFESKIVDEYGLQVPQALVAIFGLSRTFQQTDRATHEDDYYAGELDIEALTFTARFWYSEQTKLDGFRSRSLVHENKGEFTEVFDVDLQQQSAKDIIASDIDSEEKFFVLIQNDLTRRFS
jgi:hypothetical protein